MTIPLDANQREIACAAAVCAGRLSSLGQRPAGGPEGTVSPLASSTARSRFRTQLRAFGGASKTRATLTVMNDTRDLTLRLTELLRREHAALADFLVALADFDRERRWIQL